MFAEPARCVQPATCAAAFATCSRSCAITAAARRGGGAHRDAVRARLVAADARPRTDHRHDDRAAREGRSMQWLTGTSAPCLSVLKPVPLGRGHVDTGPMPSVNGFDGASLWWRAERLHRAVLKDYERRRAAFEEERRAMEERAETATTRTTRTTCGASTGSVSSTGRSASRPAHARALQAAAFDAWWSSSRGVTGCRHERCRRRHRGRGLRGALRRARAPQGRQDGHRARGARSRRRAHVHEDGRRRPVDRSRRPVDRPPAARDQRARPRARHRDVPDSGRAATTSCS